MKDLQDDSMLTETRNGKTTAISGGQNATTRNRIYIQQQFVGSFSYLHWSWAKNNNNNKNNHTV